MELQKQVWQLWSRVGFCLRLLVDLLSDLSFQIISCRSSRRGLPRVTSELLLCSAVSLAGQIRRRERSSEEVVTACIDRIKEVNSLINAVVDQRFEAALEEARKCDRIISSLSEPALAQISVEQPLLGVPFSTKEGIAVSGLHQSYGLVSRRDQIASQDASAVRQLRRAGAIPLCVTNVSEVGCWWDSANCLYGLTSNPHSLSHSPGGSSGGEAALQAAAGISISLGSDTGGSVRTPAAFCGLFGHKPTPQTVSTSGSYIHDLHDEDTTLQTLGPICRFAEVTNCSPASERHLLSQIIAGPEAVAECFTGRQPASAQPGDSSPAQSVQVLPADHPGRRELRLTSRPGGQAGSPESRGLCRESLWCHRTSSPSGRASQLPLSLLLRNIEISARPNSLFGPGRSLAVSGVSQVSPRQRNIFLPSALTGTDGEDLAGGRHLPGLPRDGS